MFSGAVSAAGTNTTVQKTFSKNTATGSSLAGTSQFIDSYSKVFYMNYAAGYVRFNSRTYMSSRNYVRLYGGYLSYKTHRYISLTYILQKINSSTLLIYTRVGSNTPNKKYLSTHYSANTIYWLTRNSIMKKLTGS